MIRINLLPEYRRKSEFPTWKLYRIIAYVFLGLSILLWGYHWQCSSILKVSSAM